MKPQSKFIAFFRLVSLLGLAAGSVSQAQTGPSPVPARAQDMASEIGSDGPDPLAGEAARAKQPEKRIQGRRGNEKDTEGTKAPNRFETDTVIKSKYHLDGQPLEVDPD